MTNLLFQLNQLREADHLVESLPKGLERSKLQKAIGKKLARLSILIQVESAKSHTEELVPHSQTLCAEDAERPCQN